MRVTALLSLLFGFLGLMILDGQTFTHAVQGIIFGVVAVVCGWASARRDYAKPICRWEGRIMAGLGVVLAILCVVQLPSTYRFQTKFNERSRKSREMHHSKPTSKRSQKSIGTAAVRAIGDCYC